ncbi:energy transducer TonB [Bacteriovorax sp. Seq25_V]|uniref:energy transducer TonB family protein n=1 Tax=Bacteriovorax sp. Seq25_V TaxID=1201288 RepID=UPI00038A16EA|nr:energy transducer TonB [Bacteriovorax sp. Seq25_V]EQC43541.1 TonB-dependent receptor [Bacteriovorax sp. Seq25_V]
MINHKRNLKKVIILSGLLSFLFHISLMPFKLDLKKIVEFTKDKEPERIKLVFRDSKNKIKQMVETQKSNSQIEKDAQYFSDSNNSFVKQMKAKNVGKMNKAGKGNSEIDSKQAQAQKESIDKKISKSLKKKKNGKVSFKDFSFSPSKKKSYKNMERVKGIENGDINSRGVAQSNDYLEEVPLGDMTALNTKEHVYYGFYYRIKLKLEQHWGSTLQAKMESLYKRKGRFPASDKYITSIKVELDQMGQIINIRVKGSSGVEELDSAAIESFNKAGPFPNPPKGMIKNGRASIEWGFAVTNS